MDTRQGERSNVGSVPTTDGASTGQQRSTATRVERRTSSVRSDGVAPGSSVGRAHTVLGISEAGATRTSMGHPSPAKKARKERGPNWNAKEITALIEAKRQENIDEADGGDPRQLMIPESGKWAMISSAVMRDGSSPCHRNANACKSKWNLMIPDYRRIADFFARTGTNEACYWSLTATQKKAEGLPRSFAKNAFYHIHEWFGERAAVTPPHSRDHLSPKDTNYVTPVTGTEELGEIPAVDGAFASADDMDVSDEGTPSSHSLEPPGFYTQARAPSDVHQLSPSGSPSTLPLDSTPLPRVGKSPTTPFVLSSSETSEPPPRRKAGNTGIRRKTVSGHALVAEATRGADDALAVEMKDIAEAGRQVEQSKIDMQFELFAQQMQYQEKRDRRLQENAKISNESALLGIEKQGLVVEGLSQLTAVLASAFSRRQNNERGPSVDTGVPCGTADQLAPASDPRHVDKDGSASVSKYGGL